jgi:hypothetical protein
MSMIPFLLNLSHHDGCLSGTYIGIITNKVTSADARLKGLRGLGAQATLMTQ